jgi:AmmeMemoRadiSam system protein B
MMRQIFASTEESCLVSDPARALVAPHIDIKSGQEVYAKAFAALGEATPHRVVVLGTGHAIESGHFSLTRKDYVTPLGRVPTHKDSVDLLLQAGGDVIEADDFAHSSEHSIEFEVLFLQHRIGQPFDVVPILIGSFGEQLRTAKRPRDIPGVGSFIDTLSGIIDADTLVVAGVDFSHVGPKFGHPHAASSYEAEFRDHDGRLLEALCRGSVEEFWAEGQRVEDRYHVCGFPVLACLLELLPGSEGIVLGYDIWYEAATRSAVSFAAVALTEKKAALVEDVAAGSII